MTTQSSRFSNITLLVLTLVFIAVFTAMSWTYLAPLIIGVMLAMLTRPLCDKLAAKGLGQKNAATLSMTILLLAVIVPLLVFAAVAIKQGITLFEYLSSEAGLGFLRSAVAAVTGFKPLYWVVSSPAELQQKGIEFLQSGAAAFSKIILVQAASLPDLALKFMLMLMSWYFMLFEGDVFVKWVLGRVPMDAGLRGRLTSSLKATAVSTVWAGSAAAGAQALLVMLGFLLLGVPGVFLAGGATFIFAWIPILGSLPVCLAGAVYLYFQGGLLKLIGIGVVTVLAGVIDNIVRPIVLRGKSDMHPLLAMVSIFSGIQFFGVLGVVFGPIVAALLLSLLNSWEA